NGLRKKGKKAMKTETNAPRDTVQEERDGEEAKRFQADSAKSRAALVDAATRTAPKGSSIPEKHRIRCNFLCRSCTHARCFLVFRDGGPLLPLLNQPVTRTLLAPVSGDHF